VENVGVRIIAIGLKYCSPVEESSDNLRAHCLAFHFSVAPYSAIFIQVSYNSSYEESKHTFEAMISNF